MSTLVNHRIILSENKTSLRDDKAMFGDSEVTLGNRETSLYFMYATQGILPTAESCLSDFDLF